MSRLDFRRKFAVLGVLLLLAVCFVTVQLYLSLDRVIATSKQEVFGLALLKPISQTVQLLQQHRGMSAGTLGGSRQLGAMLVERNQSVSKMLATTTRQLPEAFRQDSNWQRILQNWQDIADNGLGWSVETNFRRHTELIERLLDYQGMIADSFQLTLDVDIDSYYLILTEIEHLPQALEHLGKIRAYGTGILAKRSTSEQQKLLVSTLLAQSELAVKTFRHNMDKVSRFNPSVQATLTRASTEMADATGSLFGLVQTHILNEQYGIAPETFFGLVTDIIDKSYATLFQVLLPTTEKLLQQRIVQAERILWISVGFTLVTFLVVVYFSLGIYFATTANVAKLSRSAQAFANGDLGRRVVLEGRNELHQIGNSFNAMADKLSAVLVQQRESEARLAAIVDSSLDAIVQMGADGMIIGWSKQAEQMFGWTTDEAVGRKLHETIIPETYRQAHVDALHRYWATGEANILGKLIEVEALRRDGSVFPVEVAVSMLRLEAGVMFNGFICDISERKRAEEKLQMAARVFNNTHEGILVTDANVKIIDVNPTFCSITGFSRTQVLGKNPRILGSGKQSNEFYQVMWESLEAHGHWTGEIWNRRQNGELYAELLTISVVYDEKGQPLNYIGLFSDITQNKYQQQALELMAHYDVLTKLPNRTLFADRFQQAIAHSKRENTLLAVCFLDLDGFKPVNDKYGHDIGDALLVEVAARIRSNIREDDTASRLGGDEFALLLGGLESLAQCEQALARLHQALARPYAVQGHLINIGASSGVALYPLDDADPDTLLRHADQSMYRAKLEGRNRYRMFDASHDQQIAKHREHLHLIEQAFENQEFCLYYQPKVNMKTGETLGAEALLRWQHPQRGLLAPMEFLPVIDGTELEILVGNWVVGEALRQLDIWKKDGVDLQVSVNISANHLLSPGFVEMLDAALALYPDIPSHRLQLEVLESSVLGDLQTVTRVIKACRDLLGLSIALDDFGTGYSSLSHLRYVPTHTVKIDQSFVRGMIDNPNDYAIVEGVIRLAHAFRREVIAEGVETQEHGQLLLLMGCNLGQGFGIAKPMPVKQLPAWIDSYRPFPAWVSYAHRQLMLSEAVVETLQITLERWLQRMEECLQMPPGSKPEWPILDWHKCHCGRWVARASMEQIFDHRPLVQLESVHKELHHIGNALRRWFEEGNYDGVQDGLEELRSAYDFAQQGIRQLLPN